MVWLESKIQLNPSSCRRLLSRWPLGYDDLIHFPLPRLYSFLVHVAMEDPDLGTALIAQATESMAQQHVAQRAVVELQARMLEQAAAERLFIRASQLDFPFFSRTSELASGSPIVAFQLSARDLAAGGTNRRQRLRALSRAGETIKGFRAAAAVERHADLLTRRLLSTATVWLHVIREEEHKLTVAEAEHPEVPAAFIAGPPLTAERLENRTLFKGRDAVIKLIEHDLAPDRRGVLLVAGQRRMGKTSLRNYLPTYLGTGTTVIVSDFQSLSGDAHRETPHRRVLAAVAAALSSVPAPPDSPRWGKALRWLEDLDKTLTNRSLLVVIDEVERVEDGIRAGWCSTDFLDFLRAAGDCLHRIRFLLLTPYPLHRLGAHWVDRLISATSRSISYLDEKDARELVVHPIPDFPDIYPEGGVERILAETGRHPYLLQKVGDELCRLLNARGGRRKATAEELTEVFDSVIGEADLFDELWRQRTEEERASLRRLAASPEPLDPDPAALQLVREGYVERRGGKVTIAVPLFREWIVDTQGVG